MNIDFSNKLVSLRKSSKVSQIVLGQYLGVSNRAISKWETGLAYPSMENLYSLAEFFKVPIDYFFKSEGKSLNTLKAEDISMPSIKSIYRIQNGEAASEEEFEKDIYSTASFREIADYCSAREIELWKYVEETEGSDIHMFVSAQWNAMKESIFKGLNAQGILPSDLKVHRRAKDLYHRQHVDESRETKENRLVCSFAFAVSEENAAGHRIVTAPTPCGAGVLPAVLYYQQLKRGYSDLDIVHALETAALLGNVIIANTSTDTALCGCQVSVGIACAMSAAALAQLFELDIDRIEYAAEIAIEHHLGLLCDPLEGLSQIPCIERNAVAAMRAINAVNLSSFLADSRKITLDSIIAIMKKNCK